MRDKISLKPIVREVTAFEGNASHWYQTGLAQIRLKIPEARKLAAMSEEKFEADTEKAKMIAVSAASSAS